MCTDCELRDLLFTSLGCLLILHLLHFYYTKSSWVFGLSLLATCIFTVMNNNNKWKIIQPATVFNCFVIHNCLILQLVLGCTVCHWSNGIWHQWRRQATVCSLQQCSGGRLLASAYSKETQWLQTGWECQKNQRILLQWWVVRSDGIADFFWGGGLQVYVTHIEKRLN